MVCLPAAGDGRGHERLQPGVQRRLPLHGGQRRADAAARLGPGRVQPEHGRHRRVRSLDRRDLPERARGQLRAGGRPSGQDADGLCAELRHEGQGGRHLRRRRLGRWQEHPERGQPRQGVHAGAEPEEGERRRVDQPGGVSVQRRVGRVAAELLPGFSNS